MSALLRRSAGRALDEAHVRRRLGPQGVDRDLRGPADNEAGADVGRIMGAAGNLGERDQSGGAERRHAIFGIFPSEGSGDGDRPRAVTGRETRLLLRVGAAETWFVAVFARGAS